MKKKTLLVIAILLSIKTFAQTELETKVLKELNFYRNSSTILPVKYDLFLSTAAKHHSEWMAFIGWEKLKTLKPGNLHYELLDVPNFKELKKPDDRSDFYKTSITGEICNYQKCVSFNEKRISDDTLAKIIIQQFSQSPPHNEAMLMIINKIVGVGVTIKDGVSYVTIDFTSVDE